MYVQRKFIVEFSWKWIFNCMEVLEDRSQEKWIHSVIVLMENKNLLQKLLKDDCIYWRLEPVFEDIWVLRRNFGNVSEIFYPLSF